MINLILFFDSSLKIVVRFSIFPKLHIELLKGWWFLPCKVCREGPNFQALNIYFYHHLFGDIGSLYFNLYKYFLKFFQEL